MKRRVEDSVNESSSSEEEKEESPISFDSDNKEYQGSDTPTFRPGRTGNASISDQPAHYPVNAKEEVLLSPQAQGGLEAGKG